MLGGEEVNALVCDFGTYWAKSGYAGDDLPKAVFNSHCGVVEENDLMELENNNLNNNNNTSHKKRISKCVFGVNDLSFARSDLIIQNPYKDGKIENFDLATHLWNHAFTNRLRVNPKEYAVLFSEPSFNTKQQREKTCEIFFEHFEVPAFFLSKSAVLSVFSVGKSSGLVLDLGHQSTTTTPVHDGYVLQRSINRSCVGGELLVDEFSDFLEKKEIEIVPFFRVREKGSQKVEVTPSYENFMKKHIIRDAFETHFKVSEMPFTEESYATAPQSNYELPDGTILQIGPERISIPELLFNPENLKNKFQNLFGLGDMIFDSIGKSDSDIRRELFSSLIICGGNSLIPGFTERLTRELNEKAIPLMYKMKLLTPANPEKKFSSWIGGSILGSLGTFHTMWISKEEYNEHGVSLVMRKCP